MITIKVICIIMLLWNMSMVWAVNEYRHKPFWDTYVNGSLIVNITENEPIVIKNMYIDCGEECKYALVVNQYDKDNIKKDNIDVTLYTDGVGEWGNVSH